MNRGYLTLWALDLVGDVAKSLTTALGLALAGHVLSGETYAKPLACVVFGTLAVYITSAGAGLLLERGLHRRMDSGLIKLTERRER